MTDFRFGMLKTSTPPGESRAAILVLMMCSHSRLYFSILMAETKARSGTTGRSSLEMSQTENLSETGMLVRTGEVYPLGSRLSFEFHLGGQGQPIRGEGEVVRQTTAGRESVRGVGIRFISLERDGQARLQRFLRELATERGTS